MEEKDLASLMIFGRRYPLCECDTTTGNNNYYSDTTNYSQCPYCTRTDDGYTKAEMEEREYYEDIHDEIMELGRIAKRIKVKANVSILPANVINKTMQRRMMNGRR